MRPALSAESKGGLSLCLVCNSTATKTALEESCRPQRVTVFPLRELWDERGAVRGELEQLAEAAASSDAVLVEWENHLAPFVGTLSHRLRDTPSPLIALCQEEEEEIMALLIGADDILTLPFSPAYIRAQIVAHLRSSHPSSAAPDDSGGAPAQQEGGGGAGTTTRAAKRQVGLLSLDPKAHLFYIRDQVIELTPRQFALMDYLMQHVDTLVTRQQILEQAWSFSFDPGTNIVDVYIHFLRRLLKAHGLTPSIETVRGKGYRFTLPESLDTPPE